MARYCFAFVVLFLFSSSLLAVESADLPTQKQIEEAYAQKQYPEALQMIARVLPLKGEAAKKYNHHELYRLKGEMLIQQKVSSASIAFDDAADATTDAKASALDTATALLIKHSPGFFYTPKKKPSAGDPKPIEIVDPTSRQLAFGAMYEDEQRIDQPQIKSAEKGKALPPVLDAVRLAGNLHALEIASHDSDEKTKAMTTQLAAHAKTLLTEALASMKAKAEEIHTKANEATEFKEQKRAAKGRAQYETKWRLKGLSTANSNALSEIVATCEKIKPAAADLTKAFSDQKSDWQSDSVKAEEVKKLAHATMTANYSKVYDRKP